MLVVCTTLQCLNDGLEFYDCADMTCLCISDYKKNAVLIIYNEGGKNYGYSSIALLYCSELAEVLIIVIMIEILCVVRCQGRE